jgi:hypothetical protein
MKYKLSTNDIVCAVKITGFKVANWEKSQKL